MRKQGKKPSQHRTVQSVAEERVVSREKLIHHSECLREKHEHLDNQIDLMEKSANFKDEDLNYLKKKRLSIRDEIEQTNKRLDKLD